ncbi:MAG: DNA polymerase III subunit gamma/tau, partial [Campylobacter sp.]
QNLDAKIESSEQGEQTQNLTQQTQTDINDAAPSTQANSDSSRDETEPLNLNENESNLTQSSQTDLNQPAEPKFAPDFESIRDDTHDFHEAYSLKFKTDDGALAGADLAFLDDELRRLESQNAAKTEQIPSSAAKFNQNYAPQTASFGEPPFDLDGVSEMFSEAAEYDDGLFEQDASEPVNATERQKLDTTNLSGEEFKSEANFDDSFLSEANLNAQNPAPNLAAKTQTNPKAAKNQAVLKEAKRLFGEPEVLEI